MEIEEKINKDWVRENSANLKKTVTGLWESNYKNTSFGFILNNSHNNVNIDY